MKTVLGRHALVVLLSLALLSLLALNPAGPHLWAELGPALIITAGLTLLTTRVRCERRVQAQPLSFFSPNISRGPPAA